MFWQCYFDYKYERQHQTCFMQTLNAYTLLNKNKIQCCIRFNTITFCSVKKMKTSFITHVRVYTYIPTVQSRLKVHDFNKSLWCIFNCSITNWNVYRTIRFRVFVYPYVMFEKKTFQHRLWGTERWGIKWIIFCRKVYGVRWMKN